MVSELTLNVYRPAHVLVGRSAATATPCAPRPAPPPGYSSLCKDPGEPRFSAGVVTSCLNHGRGVGPKREEERLLGMVLLLLLLK